MKLLIVWRCKLCDALLVGLVGSLAHFRRKHPEYAKRIDLWREIAGYRDVL